jgi:hypothetical protein
MKMPRRYFFPPIKPHPDIFGLPHMSLLGAAFESEDERSQRIAKVEAGVRAAFKATVIHLGEDQARQLFCEVVRKPKRGRGSALAEDRDYRLLESYDQAARTGESVAAIARRLRASGADLGNTEVAIAAQIRKLVKERDARRRVAAVEARYWRMAMRREPPTLLSETLSKK